MVERRKSLELKKHVATIHSSNKLSLLQRKIANALLFNAYDKLLEKDEHSIHIATLCKLIGYDSNDYKTIKKSLVNLLATVIEWNLVDGDKVDTEGVWNASSIIADASIDGPICIYSYSNKMKKLLYQPELYGRLNMLVQAKFKSSYGLSLYENCIRYQNIEQTPWFDILRFRKLMGIEDGKYKIFRDFKHRVIDKAIEEVNKYAPISITPQFRKQGRQVVSIQFIIKQSKNFHDNSIQTSSLSTVLKMRFVLSNKQIEDVLTAYDRNYILQKISIIESSASFASGKISNLAKYLICALRDDYQMRKNSKTLLKIPKNVEIFVKNQQEKTEQTKKEDYFRYQNKQLIEIFSKQTEKEKTIILAEFEKFLGNGIYHDIFIRDGVSNILIQDQMCIFFKHNRLDFMKAISSYQEFTKIKF